MYSDLCVYITKQVYIANITKQGFFMFFYVYVFYVYVFLCFLCYVANLKFLGLQTSNWARLITTAGLISLGVKDVLKTLHLY